jgi:hypothetical protein
VLAFPETNSNDRFITGGRNGGIRAETRRILAISATGVQNGKRAADSFVLERAVDMRGSKKK